VVCVVVAAGAEDGIDFSSAGFCVPTAKPARVMSSIIRAHVVATWRSPFVDGPTGYCTPAGSKGYVQPPNDFATPALGEAVPSNSV
jgi:hypothetical protein